MSDVPGDVRDNPEQSRYDVFVGDELAGYADYELHGEEISFPHTVTLPTFGGQGVASRLIGAALDDARCRSLSVLPYCSFVRDYLAKHPDQLDLVPGGRRAEFGLPLAE